MKKPNCEYIEKIVQVTQWLTETDAFFQREKARWINMGYKPIEIRSKRRNDQTLFSIWTKIKKRYAP